MLPFAVRVCDCVCVCGWLDKRAASANNIMLNCTHAQQDGAGRGSNPGDNCELESKLELELELELLLLLLALCMAPEGAKDNTHNSAWPNSIK